jgi:hypothetical protein
VLSITCYSASLTSAVSKWGPFTFVFNKGKRKKPQGSQVRQGMTVMLSFGKKFPGEQ